MIEYLRGISNGFTEFITNRALYPLVISLTTYKYLTMGSWERDIGVSNDLTGYRTENRKEKIFSLSKSTVSLIQDNKHGFSP